VLRDDRRLAERVLAVAAEQRAEGAELEPAQVQFAPLGQVLGLLAAEPVLEREPADVVRPVGYPRKRQVAARADLVAQVVPPRRDVARPQRCARALHSAEAAARQDERPP